ncbi:hypothetical protein KC717_01570 [Candidatus Dojkabacteria bacterium]|uniref:Dockerin domain-containing protein n=1 Tax=Candidatus Dojkabacteria bacterium TaxID=2099670 RepID=A0A955RK17_9BACT|nr:hypothetical protein [Candidatus Dojkabacteria bacterium]
MEQSPQGLFTLKQTMQNGANSKEMHIFSTRKKKYGTIGVVFFFAVFAVVGGILVYSNDQEVITPDNGVVFTAECIASSPEMTCLLPIVDMSSTDSYKGLDGGLYGNGQNEPPASHEQHIFDAIDSIHPIDGKIGLVSLGMSNTSQEFGVFIQEIEQSPDKADSVTIVNGAQGGVDAKRWVVSPPGEDPWGILLQRVSQAGLTPDQVQAVWIKQANASPPRNTNTTEYIDQLTEDLKYIVDRLNDADIFPNLEIIYLSSRTYGGYADVYGATLNPEPFAYESGFSVQQLILQQIEGQTDVSYDDVPVLAWGPYLWADGTFGREYDDLVWELQDFSGTDGTHPSNSGRLKVSKFLSDFFLESPYAKVWFSDHDPFGTPTPSPTSTSTTTATPTLTPSGSTTATPTPSESVGPSRLPTVTPSYSIGPSSVPTITPSSSVTEDVPTISTSPTRNPSLFPTDGKISVVPSQIPGFPTVAPAYVDFNKDTRLNVFDLKLFITYYMEGNPVIDLNGDGVNQRDIGDFILFADEYRAYNRER